MKILILTTTYPPIFGGLETYLSEVAASLADHDLHVVAAAAPGDAEHDRTLPYAVHRYPAEAGEMGYRAAWDTLSAGLDAVTGQVGSNEVGKGGGLATLGTRAALALNRNLVRRAAQVASALQGWRGGPPDVVLNGTVYPSGLVARLLAERMGTPYAIFAHGAEIHLWSARPNQRLVLRRILGGAARVGAVSRYTAGLIESLGVPPDRITLTPPGIDPTPFQNPPDPGPLRARLGLEGRRIILTHGRLDRRKGHETVIRALPRILQRIPDACYVISGGGPHEPAIRERVATLGLEDHVVLTGPVPAGDAAALYDACEIFVMLSRRIGGNVEGFGIVCLEAAAAGKPVVAGRSGGVADAVEDGVTGLLVDPEHPDRVTDALIRLLESPEEARRMGEAGRLRVDRAYDRRAFRERTRALVDTVAAGGGSLVDRR